MSRALRSYLLFAVGMVGIITAIFWGEFVSWGDHTSQKKEAELVDFTPTEAPPLPVGIPRDDRRVFRAKRDYYNPGVPILTLSLVQKGERNDSYTLSIAPELREKLPLEQLANAVGKAVDVLGFDKTFQWKMPQDIPSSILIPKNRGEDHEYLRVQKLSVTQTREGKVVVIVDWRLEHPASKYGSFGERRSKLGDRLHYLMKALGIPHNMGHFDWDCPEGFREYCYVD
jgi:hypothetical protein